MNDPERHGADPDRCVEQSIEQSIEQVIERLVGRDESRADWQRLRTWIAVRPETGAQLIDALEADCRLREAAARLVSTGEAVALPVAAPRGERSGWRTLRAASGWLAAAVVAMLWIAERGGDAARPPEPESVATAVPAPADALPADELPALVVGTERGADGGIEVVLLRRFLDRQPADQLRAMHTDDAGQPFVAPIDFVQHAGVSSL